LVLNRIDQHDQEQHDSLAGKYTPNNSQNTNRRKPKKGRIMIGISGIIWGTRARHATTGAPTISAPLPVDTKADDPNGDTKADVPKVDTEGDADRRAADFLSRGLARSIRRDSNGEGFGE
jgi:hypothetical protein